MTSFERNAIIIGQICDVIEPGKKMLQKMMYLIERQGVNLELKYSIHFSAHIVQSSMRPYISWRAMID